MLKLHPDELVRLAPRLRLYLRRPDPTWPEVVDAADWLRHDLDVSKPLWGEAGAPRRELPTPRPPRTQEPHTRHTIQERHGNHLVLIDAASDDHSATI